MVRWTTSIAAIAVVLMAWSAAVGQTAQKRVGVRALKFRVITGWLTVVGTHGSRRVDFRSENRTAGVQELVRVNNSSGRTTISYELTTPLEHLTVDSDRPYQVRIHRQAKENSVIAPLQFTQDPVGGVTLIVGSSPDQRDISAASFWHLMLQAPEMTRTHLLPILQSLRPGWELSHTADQIENSLLRLARSGRLPDRDHWTALVSQLGSESFGERRAAERQLRSIGSVLVPFLINYDKSRLGTEQRQRVYRMTETLTNNNDDTPDRVSAWLVDDRAIWLALLTRADESKRKIAVEHLTRLLGHKIQFDPKAGEDARRKQLDLLRQRLAGN